MISVPKAPESWTRTHCLPPTSSSSSSLHTHPSLQPPAHEHHICLCPTQTLREPSLLSINVSRKINLFFLIYIKVIITNATMTPHRSCDSHPWSVDSGISLIFKYKKEHIIYSCSENDFQSKFYSRTNRNNPPLLIFVKEL